MAFQRQRPKVPQTNGDLRNPGRPALNTVLSERWFYQARITQRLERDFVLQHEGWSATPSARSASLDDVDGGPDCCVYIQMRCIEQVRIWRTSQWCRHAGLVAFIALKNIRQHCGFIDIPPLRAVFGRAAAGAYLWAGSDENLDVGIGTDDGANVAPIENRSWRGGGKLAL